MTQHEKMAPARNLLRRHCDSFGGRFTDGSLEFNQGKTSLVSSTPMAEEDDVGCSTSTTSKEEETDPYKTWLQLGIGLTDPITSSTSSSGARGRARSVELNLFPERSSLATTSTTMTPNVQPTITWEFHGLPPLNMTGYNFGQPGCSSISSSLSFGRGLRLANPPTKPQAGVWFELKAADNQGKKPFLPQIPKRYLRIKDGRMTVRILMKYLAHKLELDDESQFWNANFNAKISGYYVALNAGDIAEYGHGQVILDMDK